MFTRKTPKHPELDPLGIGFDRILKFARAAKIFEKNIGGVQICTPPAVRGLIIIVYFTCDKLKIIKVAIQIPFISNGSTEGNAS